ncbi:MAG: hypothetical protein K0R57_3516 [Paenibacillaceae bacterium]|jgi:hypothetical protein|nr:hypothetical protein [Paenibacillaceae bacterium]
MRKFLPTLILLVVLIGGYMYAKSENFFREEEKTDPVLFTLQSAEVQELRLGSGETQTVLKRTADGWEMVKPAAYPVQKYSADSLAEAFAALQVKGTVDEAPGDLAEYGLAEPVHEVEAVLADGTTRKLLAGNPLPVAGTTYVKTADDDKVYEMDDTLLSGVMKTDEDFLDKTVLQLDYDKVSEIGFTWQGQSWSLVKSDPAKKAYESAWKLGDKELKPEEGSGVLDQLTFLATDRLPRAREELDWTAAEFTLVVKHNDGTAVNYAGRLDNQLVRIAKDDGAWAFAVGATDIQAIADGLQELLTAEPEPEPSPEAGASPAAP